MRYANFKKVSPDEEQNQTTTDTNYIKKFMSVLKTKLNIEVKIASDKTETKEKIALHQKRYGISPS